MGPCEKEKTDRKHRPMIGRKDPKPARMPDDLLLAVASPAVVWIDDEPEKVLRHPEEHQTPQHFAFERACPDPRPKERQVKSKGNESERPGMKTRQRPAAHEDIQEKVFFYAPGGKVLRPAVLAFNLDFELGPNEGADQDRQQMNSHAAKEEARVMA